MARIAQGHNGVFRLRPDETRCPSCHGRDFEQAFVLRSHTIGRCTHCGLLTNLSFPQSNPDAVFDSAYHGDAQSAAFATSGYGEGDPSREIWGRGLDLLTSRTSGGRLLDVGAARGSFVALARARNWDAEGVELSRDAGRVAREEHGMPVRTGTLDHLPIDEPFDAITIWDVLEHVTDVQGTLQAARRLLQPDGVLLVTTDNFDSLIADLSRTVLGISRGTVSFPVERFFIPYNTVYFTPESLRSAFLTAGFENTYTAGIDYPLAKMNLSGPQRIVTRGLYALGRSIGRESQMLCIAQPRETD